jgi:deoxycytidylate deaminase
MTNPTRIAELPHGGAIAVAVEQARLSPCRSQRGAVVFRSEHVDVVTIQGRGRNHRPEGFECDHSAACKATCRVEAIHAEQMALLNAGRFSAFSDLLHVKIVDRNLVASGGPSCVQCSKLALAAGIAGVWLYHTDGWRRYDAKEFHALSLKAILTVTTVPVSIAVEMASCPVRQRRRTRSAPWRICLLNYTRKSPPSPPN